MIKKGRNKGFVRNQVAVMWLNKHEIESLMNERWRRKSKVKGNDIYVLEFPTLESTLENCWQKGRSCLAEKVGKRCFSVTQWCFCKIHDEICKHFTDSWLWYFFFNLNNCLVLHPEAERSKPKLPLKRGQGQETRQLFGELPLFSRQLYISRGYP